LGRAASIPPADPRNADATIRFRGGLRIELVIVRLGEPSVEDLILHREE